MESLSSVVKLVSLDMENRFLTFLSANYELLIGN